MHLDPCHVTSHPATVCDRCVAAACRGGADWPSASDGHVIASACRATTCATCGHVSDCVDCCDRANASDATDHATWSAFGAIAISCHVTCCETGVDRESACGCDVDVGDDGRDDRHRRHHRRHDAGDPCVFVSYDVGFSIHLRLLHIRNSNVSLIITCKYPHGSIVKHQFIRDKRCICYRKLCFPNRGFTVAQDVMRHYHRGANNAVYFYMYELNRLGYVL